MRKEITMADHKRVDHLSEEELQAMLDRGELTRQEFDEMLQERARRQAASRRPEDLPDSTDHTTAEGFGSGQGMGRPQGGQGPEQEIPDERGFPRTKKDEEDWPT
jgi:hypothetical protein